MAKGRKIKEWKPIMGDRERPEEDWRRIMALPTIKRMEDKIPSIDNPGEKNGM